MSNVIEWKTAAEIIEYLKECNALVSGMSVAEAAAALGFTQTASGIYVKTVITTAARAVVGSSATAVATAAAGTVATTTATNLVLFESAAGTTAATASVGGLASAVLPVAAGMLAAAGGYLLGNKIYEDNSSFLDELMFPLYDYITGQNIADTLGNYTPYDPQVPTMPLIFDASGNLFMDSRPYGSLINFLNNKNNVAKPATYLGFLNSMGWNSNPGTTQTVINAIADTLLNSPQPYVIIGNATNAFIYWTYNSTGFDLVNNVLALNSSNDIIVYLKNGTLALNKRFQKNAFALNTDGSIRSNGATDIDHVENVLPFVSSNTPIYKSILDYMNGDSPLHLPESANGLPESVTKYVPGTQGFIVPMEFPYEVPNWIPVTPPVIEPGKMPEPAMVPDVVPGTLPDPIRITPFINPFQPQPAGIPVKRPAPGVIPVIPIIPVPDPTPDKSVAPVPTPDPTKDPSVTPGLEPTPVTPQVPVNLPEPVPTGVTPVPILPIIPTISSEATGLLHVYNPTNDQINQFGAWLWTTFSGDLIDILSKLFNNPMDAVIGLHELYSTPITGSVTTIKAGYLNSGVASRLVTSRYSEIKCGALYVPEYWGNYLDYTPYTKTYCYLPFIGVVELNTDDIVGSGVEITYKIDSYNGSCIALITTSKPGSGECVTYQFSGNCAVEIPITSGMKSAVQSALIGAATTALAASTGGGAMAGAALIGGARQGANSKNLVQHSGSFGSSYGAMGLKTPYIIVKRPKQKVVAGYNENYGYPAHKMVHVSECPGYLKAIEVDVISPTATEDEKKLIETQMKAGIFVN